MPLTDVAVKNAKPAERARKLTDGGGLYVLVKPQGGKLWRYDYRFHGKRLTLALGAYPDVSLKAARERHATARQQLADGINPAAVRRAEKHAAADTFEAIAREWVAKQDWSEGYESRTVARFEKNLFPWVGVMPITQVDAPTLLASLRRVESRGAVDTAHRVKALAGHVFRYAIATGRATRDVSADLRGALATHTRRHFAAITEPKRLGELLRAADGYEGTFVVACALKLTPLLFARPGELRLAEWEEFDLDAATWRIPVGRMKSRRPHIVPLSRQAVAVLRELHPLTGSGRYVFPSLRPGRAMSNATVGAALRRLGFECAEVTPHGFRTTASTMLHEQGWPSDVIERQLAHLEGNKAKASYNHAQHFPERRKLMQSWADYLDTLKADTTNVVAFRRAD